MRSLLLCIFLLPHWSVAQDLASLAQFSQVTTLLLPLCGYTNTFKTKVDFRMFTVAGKPKGRLPFTWIMVNGIGRLEVLMLESDALPPEARSALSSLGMETFAVIPRYDRNVTYVIQPNLRAYCEVPMTPNEVMEFRTMAAKRFARTDLGKETINGQSCRKEKLVESGKTNEFALVWYPAIPTNGLPIRIDLVTRQGTARASLVHKQMKEAAASLVELPQGYVRLADGNAFIPYAMQLRNAANAR